MSVALRTEDGDTRPRALSWVPHSAEMIEDDNQTDSYVSEDTPFSMPRGRSDPLTLKLKWREIDPATKQALIDSLTKSLTVITRSIERMRFYGYDFPLRQHGNAITRLSKNSSSVFDQLIIDGLGYWSDEWERAIQEVYEAASEWDPEDGESPSKELIKLVECFTPAVRVFARLPEFELLDDGSVVLRWKATGEARSFVLRFGRRVLSAVLSQPKDGPGFADARPLTDDLNSVEAWIVRILLRPDVALLVK